VNFHWNQWNIGKCEKHGVDPADAQIVVVRARKPFPLRINSGKLLVWGQADSGEYLQVIYVLEDNGTVFVIHAMPLTERQKRQLRRRRR
jgi:uncharacterized DUF497 family protein